MNNNGYNYSWLSTRNNRQLKTELLRTCD